LTDLPKLAKPAERALLAAGYDSLEKLADASDAELLALHGMGKNALRIIRAEQAKLGQQPARLPGVVEPRRR
jgi:DNA integrity scanning protein DisA with diadenylate cyclase activity